MKWHTARCRAKRRRRLERKRLSRLPVLFSLHVDTSGFTEAMRELSRTLEALGNKIVADLQIGYLAQREKDDIK